MNVDKSKALALGGEKGSMCEVTMNGRKTIKRRLKSKKKKKSEYKVK